MTFCQHFAVAVLMFTSVASLAAPVVPDGDHDGVPDHRDQCPQTAQLGKVPTGFKYQNALSEQRRAATNNAWPVDGKGCELDGDSDGVVDSGDYCPDDAAQELAAGITDKGCPLQSDADGTPDWRDRCPDTPGGVSTDQHGCPKVKLLILSFLYE